jgi:hypothetical protein
MKIQGAVEPLSVEEIALLMVDLLRKGDRLEKLRERWPEGSEKHAQVVAMIARWNDLRERLVSFTGDWDAGHSSERN